MGLTTPPPTATPAAGPELAPAAPPRSVAAAAETAATIRALVTELTAALPGVAPAPLESLLAVAADPHALAEALIAWTGTVAAARGLAPPALAETIERGFARTIASLPRPLAAAGSTLGAAREAVRAALAPRPPAEEPLPEAAAAVRALVAELATALPGVATPAEALLASAGDPRQFSSAVLAWLSTAPAARNLPPAALADLIERGFARALLSLARPAGPAGDALGAARDRVRAALVSAGPATRPAGATALRVLTEELRAAVVESLGSAEPPPLPAADEEAGNVAAALVRWLGVSAATAGLPVSALREVVALAFMRTRDALGHEAALPAVEDVLERAREVLAGALGRPRAQPPGSAPNYRPDLPLVVAGRASRRAVRRPGPREAPRDEPEPAPRHEDPPARATAAPRPDLKGPMDLVRRYVEDLSGALPGVAAQHFVYPACIWDGRHWLGHADATRLAAHQERVRAGLAARGIAAERVLLMRVEPVSGSVAIVHARTLRESESGAALEEVETALTTVRTPQGWRIAAVLASGDAAGEKEGGSNERTAVTNRPGPR